MQTHKNSQSRHTHLSELTRQKILCVDTGMEPVTGGDFFGMLAKTEPENATPQDRSMAPAAQEIYCGDTLFLRHFNAGLSETPEEINLEGLNLLPGMRDRLIKGSGDRQK